MLKLIDNNLKFSFPEVHEDAVFGVDFQRTLRIPDDGKEYPLPPGLGKFPVKHIDDHRDRVPASWVDHGGVMLPMFQSEAMWLSFHATTGSRRQSPYPFAIRVATGKVNAISGKEWKKKLHKGDYMTVPPQPWLDGFCVEAGKIRQFVAMPIGWGFSVEKQVTGKEEFGGLQIEVCPMKAAEYEKRFPKKIPVIGDDIWSGRRRCMTKGTLSMNDCCEYDMIDADLCRSINPDMALGAGGLMKQQIFEDKYGLDVWDTDKAQKVFVHLTNSFAWQAITGHSPPTVPQSAEDYARHGLPWFDHYLDGVPIAEGGKNLKEIKSILALGFQKGIGVFPDNKSIDIPVNNIKIIKGSKDTVRNGTW